MMIEDLPAKRNMTKYRPAVVAEVPHTTLNDIRSGKIRLEKCSAEVPLERNAELIFHEKRTEK